MIFNEDSRVKTPSILHLIQLGYSYLSLKDVEWDESTNIFTEIFNKQLGVINSGLSKNDIPRLITLRTGEQQAHINKKTVDTSLIINPTS